MDMNKQHKQQKEENSIEARVNNMVIEFARNNSNVVAVFKGNSPEEQKQTVYYIIPKTREYNREFRDKLTDLALEIFADTMQNIGIMCWPVEIEKIKGDAIPDYPHTGTCIYKKNP